MIRTPQSYQYLILRLYDKEQTSEESGYLVVRREGDFLSEFLKDHVTALGMIEAATAIRGVFPKMVRKISATAFAFLQIDSHVHFTDDDQLIKFLSRDVEWCIFENFHDDYLFSDLTDPEIFYTPYRVSHGIFSLGGPKLIFDLPKSKAIFEIEGVVSSFFPMTFSDPT